MSSPVRLTAGYQWRRLGDEQPVDPTCDGVTQRGVVGLINVYDSRYPFPEGVKIESLRIVQLLPKTAANHHESQIGYGAETGARRVLGTVPVEADGSAYFYVPPAPARLFPGPRPAGIGRAVDAQRDVRARGREAHVRRLPRGQGPGAVEPGGAERAWRFAARRRRFSRRWKARTR